MKRVEDKYRSLFFWAWDDKLEPQEIRAQVRLMHEQGVGGFFMHSRFGLETPYLSKEWDDAVLAAVDEAKKLGMEAWIYDEDRWPSGFCGGRVQKAVGGLEGLTLEVTTPGRFQKEGTEILYWTAQCQGDELSALEQIDKPQKAEGKQLLVLRLEKSGPSPWFNGYPPPNNLDPKSEQAFIRFTHEHYRQLLGPDFASLVKGSFTDEPSMADRHSAFNPKRSWIPWASGMRDWMRKQLGYDWVEKAPHFYFNTPESAKTRFDYWHMVALRFESCYSGQIADWSHAHGVAYTGHFLQEDRLGLATRVNGSIMPHYSHEDICGIDLLGEQTREYLTLKQCSSVVHQLHKSGMLVETYAGCGWQFSFEAEKWIGDWMYALGVTRRCQHLALYSLRGCRKRDYPPCFNYQNTWYGKLHVMEEYFAVLSEALSKGTPRRDVLLVHPAGTAWMEFGSSPYGNPKRGNERDVKKVDEIGFRLNDLLKYLCGAHYDVDLGDETLIERYGSVKGHAFRIGEADYPVVVLPDLENLYTHTFTLLKAFTQQGGTVLVYGRTPDHLDGLFSEEAKAFFQGQPHVRDAKELVHALEGLCVRPLSVREGDTECPSVIVQVREDGPKETLFVVNNDRTQAHHLALKVPEAGALVLVDPFTGERAEVGMDCDGTWQVDLEPTGSRLYQMDLDKKPYAVRKKQAFEPEETLSLEGPYAYSLDQPDTLTLDKAAWSLDGSPFSEEMEIWAAQEEVRRKLGMVSLLDDEIAQRYTWDAKPHSGDGHQLSLRYRFTCRDEEEVDLVVETARSFRFRLDGKEIDPLRKGWIWDKSFDRLALGRLGEGTHELVLSCTYTNAMELEDIYLAGAFGVNGKREITALPERLSIGDWTKQGLFHYPGSVGYRTSFATKPWKKLWLSLPSWKGTCVTVTLNGTSFELAYPGRGGLDLSAAPWKDHSELEIRVYGSLRNQMGPLHLTDLPEVAGPASFTTKGDAAYHVVPYGLETIPVLQVYR